MKAIEEFVLATYPALRDKSGQLTFEVEELNRGGLDTPTYVDFAECQVGSRIAAPAEPWRYHPCPIPTGGLPLTDYLLRAKVDIASRTNFKIHEFWAHGKLITAKLDELRERLKKSRGWTHEEVLERMRQAGPKFGPEQQEAFLQQVPVQLVEHYSGCKLDLSKAQLVAHSNYDYLPGPVLLELYWEIPGNAKRRHGKGIHGQIPRPCSARFEPFEGNLIGLYVSY